MDLENFCFEGSESLANSPDIRYKFNRKIIHIDMDAFYASVEIRDNPLLKNRPLVVGSKKGVVLTASYEARKFGIGSGMPGFQAAEKCKGLIFVHPRFAAYKEASEHTREIFQRYTDTIATCSLDEAYLDVTDNKLGLYAVEIARRIRQEVFAEIGLTCSAGVAANMMLAKIASDYKKPNGLTVILPTLVTEFMCKLPLKKIPGVGPATEKNLTKHKLLTCSDIWQKSLSELQHLYGERFAYWIYKKSRGWDKRDVGYQGERKTYGAQRTIGARFHPISELEERLHKIAQSLSERMIRGGHLGRTVTLKVRFGDLRIINRSKTLDHPECNALNFGQTACALLKKTPAAEERVRLVGISISNLQKVSKD